MKLETLMSVFLGKVAAAWRSARDTPLSPPVVVINETMALRFFPDEDPIGKRLDISGPTYLREIV